MEFELLHTLIHVRGHWWHLNINKSLLWCLDGDSTVMPDLTHSIVGLLVLGKGSKIFSRLTIKALQHGLNSCISLSSSSLHSWHLPINCEFFATRFIHWYLILHLCFLFLALTDKTIYLVMFLIGSTWFRLLYHSLCRCQSCWLISFKGIIYHAEAIYGTLCSFLIDHTGVRYSLWYYIHLIIY